MRKTATSRLQERIDGWGLNPILVPNLQKNRKSLKKAEDVAWKDRVSILRSTEYIPVLDQNRTDSEALQFNTCLVAVDFLHYQPVDFISSIWGGCVKGYLWLQKVALYSSVKFTVSSKFTVCSAFLTRCETCLCIIMWLCGSVSFYLNA